MNRASRRIGMYFHSDASASCPWRVRVPHTTGPTTGLVIRQLMPSGLSCPFSASVSGTLRSAAPEIVAAKPAGAFHTPRSVSVRAMTPATAPLAANTASRFSRSGSRSTSRGKNNAAFLLIVPTAARPAIACAGVVQVLGASMISSAPASRSTPRLA